MSTEDEIVTLHFKQHLRYRLIPVRMMLSELRVKYRAIIKKLGYAKTADTIRKVAKMQAEDGRRLGFRPHDVYCIARRDNDEQDKAANNQTE